VRVRVLGVDPGLTRCGWGVVDGLPGRRARLVDVGVVRTPVDAPLAERLLAVCEGLEAVLGRCAPEAVAAWTMLLGGAATTAGALLWEPGAAAALDGRWGAAAWAAWSFLLLGGSLVAYTIYLHLVRDWGAARAGAYAFVSPVVALALGVAVFGERVGAWECSGSAVMLAAAWLALRGDAPSRPAPAAAPSGTACRPA
jgi:drug/metabolite transporter (DMT)-like permease